VAGFFLRDSAIGWKANESTIALVDWGAHKEIWQGSTTLTARSLRERKKKSIIPHSKVLAHVHFVLTVLRFGAEKPENKSGARIVAIQPVHSPHTWIVSRLPIM
jgi:hypothetical protein